MQWAGPGKGAPQVPPTPVLPGTALGLQAVPANRPPPPPGQVSTPGPWVGGQLCHQGIRAAASRPRPGPGTHLR